MTDERHNGKSHEGVPRGEPLIELTVRLFPGPGRDEPSWPPTSSPFSGATLEWSYPAAFHGQALDRVAVWRHAINVLPDNLEGGTTIDSD